MAKKTVEIPQPTFTRGDMINRPEATSVTENSLYYAQDLDEYYRSVNGVWQLNPCTPD